MSTAGLCLSVGERMEREPYSEGMPTCLAALAIDVTSLEPYMCCAQPINKAQGSALGSLALNPH